MSSSPPPTSPNSPPTTPPPPPPPPRRKLRPLIITTPNSPRHAQILQLFTSSPTMKHHFETPQISPSIPSRSIRSQYNLLQTAQTAGLLPPEEWDAISSPDNILKYKENPECLLNCLKDNVVPIKPRLKHKGDGTDVHYCVELWRKSKGLNRGRAVLGCVLAHLIAMKTFVEEEEEKYDFILEDNVRAPIGTPASLQGQHEEEYYCECAQRIRETMEASQAWEEQQLDENKKECHLRYYGWLGSIPNLEWILNEYIPKTSFPHKTQENDNGHDEKKGGVFPFPSFVVQINDDNETTKPTETSSDTTTTTSTHNANTKGGTPIWGAYAYWISKTGYNSLLQSLQNDVGAFLWKGKRMRNYLVKPIDKILPRRILSTLGGDGNDENDGENGKESSSGDGFGVVHVTTKPAFFRAPMLSSKIHPQWDEGFCRSTEYQMSHYGRRRKTRTRKMAETSKNNDDVNDNNNKVRDACINDDDDEKVLDWDELWLTTEEREIVEYKKRSCGNNIGSDADAVNGGVWLTLAQLSEMKKKKKESEEQEVEHGGEET